MCVFDESTSTAKEVKVARSAQQEREERQEREPTESAGELVPVKVKFFFRLATGARRSVALWANVAGSDWRTLRLPAIGVIGKARDWQQTDERAGGEWIGKWCAPFVCVRLGSQSGSQRQQYKAGLQNEAENYAIKCN